MPSVKVTPPTIDIFDDDEEDGWEDMPVVREDDFACGLDQEDQHKYHYVHTPKRPKVSGASAGNATGNLIDVDDRGNEWRSKLDVNENEYTRLPRTEEDDVDEVHLRTRYLFDEDKAMTPLNQMQATKNLLTEAQRIAYVGLCRLTSREMAQNLKTAHRKELTTAIQNMELWAMKIMGRLYYHMELETAEQKMIESLANHGVQAADLVPALMTTHTVANPEYDPAEARRRASEKKEHEQNNLDDYSDQISEDGTLVASSTPSISSCPSTPTAKTFQTTAKVLADPSQASMPGVTTSLSAADENVTLDIRWTVLCDLFLVLIADSVYDARSRVLLENVAIKLGLGWLDVVKFERRVTEALEIQEGVETLEHQDLIEMRQKAARNKRFVMMGLATFGGGLVIGLSAGLLAPVIGAGLGAAFSTIGIAGTGTFLAGAGGAAVITTGGVLTGSAIAGTGMARRTQQVQIFDVLPLHNNKRVNCILTVPGMMTGPLDDVRLPFSVLDTIVGDVFSVLWEPEMLRETGSALKILTTEIISQLGQTVLQQTVMTALMSALQWPIILTKLGYLIDNPWNNALDRARAAGGVLADVLMQRHLGVRPMTLIGFSLGARVIFYALLELAKQKAYGIVQDVFLLGTTLTASTSSWCEARSVVSGRFVNGFARNDWVLNYLFRATSGGLSTVAGLRPIENVPGLENVDVTDKISGHMSYRTFMPLILDQLGFPVSSDYFDEPVEPDFTEDRIVVKDENNQPKKKSWFSKKPPPKPQNASRPPSAATLGHYQSPRSSMSASDDGLPPRTEKASTPEVSQDNTNSPAPPAPLSSGPEVSQQAGFDFAAIKEVIEKADIDAGELEIPAPDSIPAMSIQPPARPQSAPRSFPESSPTSPSSPGEFFLGPPPRPTGLGARQFQPRSVSFNDVQYAEYKQEKASYDDDTPSFTTSQPQSTMPTLSFGSVDGTPWSSELGGIADSPVHEPLGNRSILDLRSSMDALSFGHRTRSSFDKFAASDPVTAFSSGPSLSFGGTDGTITPGATLEKDSWGSRTFMTDVKRINALNSNPWAS